MRANNGRQSPSTPSPGHALRRGLAARVQALRQHHGKTQAALAAEVGCRPWTISRIERAATVPSIEVLVPLARALHVFVDYLLTGTRSGRVRDPRLAERLDAINRLPPGEIEQLLRLLDAFLDRPTVAPFTGL